MCAKKITVQFRKKRELLFEPRPVREKFKRPKTKASRKKDDRRGRHTKESRARKAQETALFYRLSVAATTCANCNGAVFVPTSDSDTFACTSCGYVTNERVVDGACDFTMLTSGSPRYRHINYFAERIQQCRNREPRFTASEQNKINVVWSELHDQDGITWSGSPKSFSKHRFRQICRILNELEPGRRWKQKLERWWQARVLLYGHDSDWNTLDDYHSMVLKDLFMPIACWFDQYYKSQEAPHNIPKLDLIFLVLLYNISEESVQRYGWYFLSKNIVWPTKSTLSNYHRIRDICDSVNREFADKRTLAKRHKISERAMRWCSRNRYVVPELDLLVYLAKESREGFCTYNHLCNDDRSPEIELV